MIKEISLTALSLLGFQFVEAQKPNIIFIYADDWGYGDLSLHGHPVITTPNLDRLANEGINFKQFNVLSPVCSPSRTAILTGHYPARYCIHQHFATPEQNRERGMPDWLDPLAPTLPRMLKEAGYRTAHFGKWHLTNSWTKNPPFPVEYGYDESIVFNGPGPRVNVPIGISTGACVDHTIDFITRSGNEPFFVNLWIHESHTVISPPQDAKDAYAHVEEPYRSYYACISYADRELGRLFTFLREQNLDENTLVVFSSDNGPESPSLDPNAITYYSRGSTAGLRGQKRSLHEGGVGVPFIVHWPGKVPAGQVNNVTNISGVDILPTFLSIAGLEIPEDYVPDGEDLSPAFFGHPVTRTKPLFWEWRGPSHGENWPRLAIRKGDWKLLANFEGSVKTLYNIQASRVEQSDSSTFYPELVNELFQLLLDWKATLPTEPDPACIEQIEESAFILYNDFYYKQYVKWTKTSILTFTDKVDNPVPSGVNPDPKTGKVIRGSGKHAHILFPLEEYLDLSTNNLFKVKVLYEGVSPPPSNCNVRLILRNNGLGTTQYAKTLPVTEANKWNDYTFDCSGAHLRDTYNQVLLLFSSPDDIGNSEGQVFYIDDLMGPPINLGAYPDDVFTSMNGDSVILDFTKNFSDLELLSDLEFELFWADDYQNKIPVSGTSYDLNAIYLHIDPPITLLPSRELLLAFTGGIVRDIDGKELTRFDEFLVRQIPPPPHVLKFLIRDYYTHQFISNVSLNVGTLSGITNSSGEITFLLPSDNYLYTILKDNYFPVTSEIELTSDTVVNIKLKKSIADLRFRITDGFDPIYNAVIDVNSDIKYTNTLGLATFTGLPVHLYYPYTIFGNNYKTVNDSLYLLTDSLVEVSLEISTFTGNTLQKEMKLMLRSGKEELIVESNQNFQKIEFINILGEWSRIYENLYQNSQRLDISGLNKGIYIIRVHFQDGCLTRKVIL